MSLVENGIKQATINQSTNRLHRLSHPISIGAAKLCLEADKLRWHGWGRFRKNVEKMVRFRALQDVF